MLVLELITLVSSCFGSRRESVNLAEKNEHRRTTAMLKNYCSRDKNGVAVPGLGGGHLQYHPGDKIRHLLGCFSEPIFFERGARAYTINEA